MYTQLGVMTKGTIVEVNVSELGMVTTGGKVVFGKYAQITNNPENDGCINAVLCKFSAVQLHFTFSFADLPSPLSGVIGFCMVISLYYTVVMFHVSLYYAPRR